LGTSAGRKEDLSACRGQSALLASLAFYGHVGHQWEIPRGDPIQPMGEARNLCCETIQASIREKSRCRIAKGDEVLIPEFSRENGKKSPPLTSAVPAASSCLILSAQTNGFARLYRSACRRPLVTCPALVSERACVALKEVH